MFEYKVVSSADLLPCTFQSISSSILHQIGCVNICWKAYTTRYQIYNNEAIDFYWRVNNGAENSSVWLTQSWDSLSVREQTITPRTRVGLGWSAPIIHFVMLYYIKPLSYSCIGLTCAALSSLSTFTSCVAKPLSTVVVLLLRS